MSPHAFIERRTGLIYGTYRWGVAADGGPRPRLVVIIRPPNPSHVRFEIGLLGRSFYLTWGHQI